MGDAKPAGPFATAQDAAVRLRGALLAAAGVCRVARTLRGRSAPPSRDTADRAAAAGRPDASEPTNQGRVSAWPSGGGPYLRKVDIARHCGVSLRTVTRWMRAGMPHYKPFEGGAVLFRASECEEWVSARQARKGVG